jgi:hypothetical protein
MKMLRYCNAVRVWQLQQTFLRTLNRQRYRAVRPVAAALHRSVAMPSLIPFRSIRVTRSTYGPCKEACAASARQVGRRQWTATGLATLAVLARDAAAPPAGARNLFADEDEVIDAAARKGAYNMSEEEWKKKLTQPQYAILREASTERPFGNALNAEKRSGAARHLQVNGCGCAKSLARGSHRTLQPRGLCAWHHVRGRCLS